jgi:hypothetical protein
MAKQRILYDQDGVKVGILKDWRLNPLTTEERLALGATLGLDNVGLSVFDKGDTKQYFWTGTTWVAVGSNYVLPKATTVLLGGIIVGDNLTIDGNGRLSAQSGNAVLLNDLTANLGEGGSVGGVDTGDFYPTGTLLENILRDILTVAKHPLYIPPTLTLTGYTNKDLEIGTVISPTLNINFTQNDSGGHGRSTLI